jgi:hypothetical protein
MRFTRVTTVIAIGAFLLASIPAFAGSYSGSSFTVVSQPDLRWTRATYLSTPMGPDYTVINSLGPFDFSTGLTELSVPSTWASWNCGPATESCTPRVLATPGDSLTINIEYANPDAKIFGFELQPKSQQADEIRVDFFNGSTLLGTIDQSVNGNAGALLFAGIRTSYFRKSNGQLDGGMPFTNVKVTDLSGNSFAIAELRAAPEPSAPIMLGSGLLTLVVLMRRKLLARAW